MAMKTNKYQKLLKERERKLEKMYIPKFKRNALISSG